MISKRLSAALSVAALISAGVAATAGTASAAATPLSVTLTACGQGASAVWDTSGNPVLTSGTAAAGTCGAPSGSSYDPSYAQVAFNGVTGIATPQSEPFFDASTYQSGSGDPRLVMDLSNGKELVGYSPQAGLNGTDMAWAVGNSGTYTSYSTAYSAVGASGTTVKDAYIVNDASDAGTAITLTNVQFNGQSITGSPYTTVSSRGGIKNAYSGKCMDVTGGSFATGTLIQQWTCGAKAPNGVAGGDQQFQYTTHVNGSVKTGYLEAISPSGQIFYVTPANGQQLELSAPLNSAEDMLKSGPYYTFPNSNVVADDSGWSTANGGKVIGYALTKGTNQQWSLP